MLRVECPIRFNDRMKVIRHRSCWNSFFLLLLRVSRPAHHHTYGTRYHDEGKCCRMYHQGLIQVNDRNGLTVSEPSLPVPFVSVSDKFIMEILLGLLTSYTPLGYSPDMFMQGIRLFNNLPIERKLLLVSLIPILTLGGFSLVTVSLN